MLKLHSQAKQIEKIFFCPLRRDIFSDHLLWSIFFYTAAVSCSADGAMLVGAGLGFWLTGKPCSAWVGAWHQCMGSVHGMVCMGLVGLGLSIGVWFWMMCGDVIIGPTSPIIFNINLVMVKKAHK